ncbi:MAG: AAA family ATPase [Candidatus Eisenbacteria bacterium]|nr:AAA family ATPase [Candidatus Eisenbacteria bacterium]
MYETHFGLRENPFPAGHQMRFLYPSREHQEARAHLRYGIENREPFVLITGEVGTGKTTALYDALAEWGTQVTVALITNSALSRQELLEEICLRFGLSTSPGMSKPQMLAALERHLSAVRSRGEHAVLLLDESQNLPVELLEEIRLLSNTEIQGEKLLQIFLVGQPELEAKLARAELRQLRQRITVHYRLNPLSPEETAGYIHHRLSVAGGNAVSTFPPDACRAVYRVTHGIPREINTVAAQALLTAYADGAKSVRPEHVTNVAKETEFRSVLGAPTEVIEPAPVELPPPPVAPAVAATPPAPIVPEPIAPAIIEERTPVPTWTPPELAAEPIAEFTPPALPDEPVNAVAPEAPKTSHGDASARRGRLRTRRRREAGARRVDARRAGVARSEAARRRGRGRFGPRGSRGPALPHRRRARRDGRDRGPDARRSVGAARAVAREDRRRHRRRGAPHGRDAVGARSRRTRRGDRGRRAAAALPGDRRAVPSSVGGRGGAERLAESARARACRFRFAGRFGGDRRQHRRCAARQQRRRGAARLDDRDQE